MTVERAIDLMRIEKACVIRAKTCNRDCRICDLVQDDADLLEAYDTAIEALTMIKEEKL